MADSARRASGSAPGAPVARVAERPTQRSRAPSPGGNPDLESEADGRIPASHPRHPVEGMSELDLAVRCGLHTGEWEFLGGDVGGIAVHIGARVGSLAPGGEALARARSRTWWWDSSSASRVAACRSCAACPAIGGCMRWSGKALQGEDSQLVQHQPRVLEDVAVGVAAELVAACARLSLATAVLLPRVAGMVVAIAVELHGQSLLGPAAVDPASAGGAVRLGQGKSVRSQQVEEAPLQRAEGDVRVAAENAAKRPSPARVRSAREDTLDLRRRRAVQHPRLVARARELVRRQDGGEVHQRARRGGDGDAAPDRRLAPSEVT